MRSTQVKPLNAYVLMIEAQGGNIHVINDESLLAIGKFTFDVTAPQDGYIHI